MTKAPWFTLASVLAGLTLAFVPVTAQAADVLLTGTIKSAAGEAIGGVNVSAKPDGQKGFKPLPKRWVVEQTFGRLQRYRRLRVDDEMSNETSRHMTVLASLLMTGMRLERMLHA